ncbi:MAG: 30S ribosomal protein S28e [Nanoarchaeota archaeon]|nr:30S ribosomal protein S28e [Nanoarchaeota archaeon]MBU1005147.1 30S ribosomal protein S28e [Nanoarchaeota archaeon]MBU1946388.1 30S ribosomal protein S28e [Nanoarchaeota archaeon]
MADKKNSQPEGHQKEDVKPSRKRAQEEVKKGNISFTPATPARVEEIIGRTGTRGEAIQVRCKVLEGRDQNKVLRRNIKGPIQLGDILMLRETEIEAKQLSKAGRGSGA